MMDFNERVIPNITANYLFQESLARYEFVVKKIGNNIKILDAACGTGYGSRVLSRRGEVVGLDNDAEAINFAKARYSKYANFLLGDIENIKQNVGTFDVICCFEAIEHLKQTNIYNQSHITITFINQDSYLAGINYLPEWNPVDFLIVDANHEYSHVLADIQAWWPKIRPGGYIFFHDFIDLEQNGTNGVSAAIQDALSHGYMQNAILYDTPGISCVYRKF